MGAVLNTIFYPFAWIASLPVRVFTWIVLQFKPVYDPESITCPGCGFKGDDGTGGKSCRIEHVAIDSAELAMNQHTCFRCNAKFYTKLFTPARDWIKR